jgi:hypothetical protein
MSLSNLFSNLRKEQNFTVSVQVNPQSSTRSTPSSSKDQRKKRSRGIDCTHYPQHHPASMQIHPNPTFHQKELQDLRDYRSQDSEQDDGWFHKSTKRDTYSTSSIDRSRDSNGGNYTAANRRSSASQKYSDIDSRYRERSVERTRVATSHFDTLIKPGSPFFRRSIDSNRYSLIEQERVEPQVRGSPSSVSKKKVERKPRPVVDERMYAGVSGKLSSRSKGDSISTVHIKQFSSTKHPKYSSPQQPSTRNLNHSSKMIEKTVAKQYSSSNNSNSKPSTSIQPSKQKRQSHPLIEKSLKRSPSEKVKAIPTSKSKIVAKRTRAVSDEDIFLSATPLMKASTAINLNKVFPSIYSFLGAERSVCKPSSKE